MRSVTNLLLLMLVTAGALACDEAPGVGSDSREAAREARAEVERRIDQGADVDPAEVRAAARDACRAVPVDQLAETFDTDPDEVREVAERFAENFPEDVRDEVREGCLEGLDA